jgi:putative hemolysin
MLNIEQALVSKFPGFFRNKNGLASRFVIKGLKILFAETEINRFLEEHEGLKGIDFIEKVLDYFDFSYAASNRSRENIPATGAVIIVANHPLGALDALSLIKLVSEVRPDIRVVGNDLLSHLEPLRQLLLPINNMGKLPGKNNIKAIEDALKAERAVIMFPSGEVSRANLQGIRDGRWQSGFLRFAQKLEVPILPVFLDARNSWLFYGMSMLWKPLGTILLVNEMFRQRSVTMPIRVGEMIPSSYISSHLKLNARVKLVKKHLYRIGNSRSGLIETVSSIAHPENRQTLKNELRDSQLLGTTSDGKRIYLVDYRPDSSVIREIGRLREVTFRRVGEGTGRRRDKDKYDQYYRHIVLWDEDQLELVGAYRIGEGRSIHEQMGETGLYVSSLFQLEPEFINNHLPAAIELGRSFVQPAYWGSRALDYLWQGIGAYLATHPQVSWMYGPVSISNNYPRGARDLLVYFYRKYFGSESRLATERKPYDLGGAAVEEYDHVFDGSDYRENFRILKELLANYNVTVPTLFKQYSELCEDRGTCFLGFNVDPEFGNCIDGLVLVDVKRIKESKWRRYVGSTVDAAA